MLHVLQAVLSEAGSDLRSWWLPMHPAQPIGRATGGCGTSQSMLLTGATYQMARVQLRDSSSISHAGFMVIRGTAGEQQSLWAQSSKI